jgi:DNA adenine methylase
MCGVLRHVRADCRRASDVWDGLIVLWRALQAGYVPPDAVSRELYLALKSGPDCVERTFAGAACCWGGSFFNGFDLRRFHNNRNRLMDIAVKLQDVNFESASYLDIDRPHDSVVYCDPPYRVHKGKFAPFDHEEFWATMREWSTDNIVFISETSAPPDFKCIWQKQVPTTVRQDGVARGRVERLYVHETIVFNHQ